MVDHRYNMSFYVRNAIKTENENSSINEKDYEQKKKKLKSNCAGRRNKKRKYKD